MTEERVKEIIEAVSPTSETLALLESLAAYWEGRSKVHEEVAERWDDSKSGREQKMIDSGIAAGYHGVARDLRTAVEALTR